jgi:hypothetical protein
MTPNDNPASQNDNRSAENDNLSKQLDELQAEPSSRLKYDKEKRTIVAVTGNLTMCKGCRQPVSKDWAYCPCCGAQDRIDVAAPTAPPLDDMRSRLSYRLNDHLCEMKPDHDDSIAGFNEAWDVVRNFFDDEAARVPKKSAAAPLPGESTSDHYLDDLIEETAQHIDSLKCVDADVGELRQIVLLAFNAFVAEQRKERAARPRPDGAWWFDRYVDGKKMSGGAVVENAATLDDAMRKVATMFAQLPGSVLVPTDWPMPVVPRRGNEEDRLAHIIGRRVGFGTVAEKAARAVLDHFELLARYTPDGMPAKGVSHTPIPDGNALSARVAILEDRIRYAADLVDGGFINEAMGELDRVLNDPDMLDPASSLVPVDDGENRLTLDTERQVFFYEQDFYVLSNFSSFRLDWNRRDFDTAEAAYHWAKFPESARVRTEIMHASSAHEAFKIAQENKAVRRPDWDDVRVGIMLDILRAKAAQHEYVRRKLLATEDRELVENSWRDAFWGWGPNRDGQNMLGKLWMQVRAELRAQPVSGLEANAHGQ